MSTYCKNLKTDEMTCIDYGFGRLRADALMPYLENVAFDLAEVYQGLLAQNQLMGYEVFERFYEIGSSNGLSETADFLVQRRHDGGN